MVDNIIRPALLDRAGVLIVTGTPSPVPAGFFYDIWTNKRWSRHSWTLYDNPTKAKAFYDAFLAKERADRGITEADPAYRREWLGEWAIEEELRVYKYGAINNVQGDVSEFELANGIKGRRCITRHPLMSTHNKHLWRHAVGIDIGSGDRTAIVVLGQHLNDTHHLPSVRVGHLRAGRGRYSRTSSTCSSSCARRKHAAELVLRLWVARAASCSRGDVHQRDHGLPAHRGREEDRPAWANPRLGEYMAASRASCSSSVSAVAEDMLWVDLERRSSSRKASGSTALTWHPDPAEALRYCATGIHPYGLYKAKIRQSKKQEVEAAGWRRSIEAEMIAPPMGGLVDGDVSLEDSGRTSVLVATDGAET